MSSLASCLHCTAIAARPKDVISGQPRLSNVFSLAHFANAISELSVMSLQ